MTQEFIGNLLKALDDVSARRLIITKPDERGRGDCPVRCVTGRDGFMVSWRPGCGRRSGW